MIRVWHIPSYLGNASLIVTWHYRAGKTNGRSRTGSLCWIRSGGSMVQVISAPSLNLKTWTIALRYFAFIPNIAEETLAVNYSVDGGSNWTWASAGSPPAGVLSTPAATTFVSNTLASDGSSIGQFYVFIVGNDGNLWLCISLDDGKSWAWFNQGLPPNVSEGFSITGAPDAISRNSIDSGTEVDIYCYVIGSDGNLYVRYSEDNGGTWQWKNREAPQGTTLAAGTSTSIAFFDYTRQSVYTFAAGQDNNLYAHYGDGNQWHWQPLGQPTTTGVANTGGYVPGAVTFLTDVTKAGNVISSNEAIIVFVLGEDGQLYACYSPAAGTDWQWKYLGEPYHVPPPQSSIQSFFGNALLVATESNAGIFTWPIFVGAVGYDFKLYMDFTTDASEGTSAVWEWQPRGSPTGVVLTSIIGAVCFFVAAGSWTDSQIFIFVNDDGNDVHTCRWDGSQWTWHDQQGPP